MKQFLVTALVLCSAALAQNGSTVYQQCQGCHQPTGVGIPGTFPPLAARMNEILAAKGGREWLIHLVLSGMSGEITVKGQKYNGAMPAYAQLKDAELAAVLNHITTNWGNTNPKAFTAAEVKAQRSKKMTGAQVNTARKALNLK